MNKVGSPMPCCQRQDINQAVLCHVSKMLLELITKIGKIYMLYIYIITKNNNNNNDNKPFL